MTIREVITKQIQKRQGGPEPFDMALFTVNMAGIILLVCHDLLEADVGKVFREGKQIGGQERDPLSITDFIDVINGKAEPDFTPEQGLNMVKILEALYKSAETGSEVKL